MALALQLFPYPNGSDDSRSRRRYNGVALLNSTVIVSYSITSNVISFVTNVQSPALTTAEVVVLNGFNTSQFLNGLALTVSATGLTTTTFQAPLTHANVGVTTEPGYLIQPQNYATGGVQWATGPQVAYLPGFIWQMNTALGGATVQQSEIFSSQQPVPIYGSVQINSGVGPSASGAAMTYLYNYYTGYLRIFNGATELANAASIPADVIVWSAEFARAL